MARIITIPWALCALIGLGGLADADERFAGTWQAGLSAGGIKTTLHVVMLADGTFTTVIESDAGEMRISGTYRVIDERTIHFMNQDFTPRQQCVVGGGGGNPVCTKIEIPAEETDSYAFDHNGSTLILANPESGEMRFERVE